MALAAFHVYDVSMCVFSIVCGIIGLVFVYQFQAYSRSRFLKIRKPTLILLYCLFSLIMLLILSPIKLVLHLTGINTLFWLWLFELIHNLCITCMLVVIGARCWLLYYDHLYSLSTVDMTWRGAINSNQEDFWLRHRKTWGDFGFIICVSIVVAVAVFIALCGISIFALQHQSIQSLHIATLILVVLPCCLSIWFITLSKQLKTLSLYDEFQIIQEMKYLSLSTVLILLSSIMCVTPADQFTLSIIQTAETLFCIISTYIQTQWVLTQLRRQTKVLLRKKHALRSRKHKRQHLEMNDILQHKDGFEMFMRHCQRELNVEGLLFIVEVAQFKARLHRFIRNIERTLKGNEHTLLPPPQDEAIDQSASDRSGDPSVSTTDTSGGKVKERTPSPLPALKQLASRSLTTTHPNHRFADQIDGFKDTVLEQQWIPISQHMFKPKKRSNSDCVRISSELQLVVTNRDSNKSESMQDDDRITRERHEIMELQAEDTLMYEHAQHLFLKYIDTESEFTINVSYEARKDLLLLFSKDKVLGFQSILMKNEITNVQSNEMVFSKMDQLVRSLVIKEFLYSMFDCALSEIWKLLSSDSYVRFMQTKQYQYLLKHQKT
eukprot:722214_1